MLKRPNKFSVVFDEDLTKLVDMNATDEAAKDDQDASSHQNNNEQEDDDENIVCFRYFLFFFSFESTSSAIKLFSLLHVSLVENGLAKSDQCEAASQRARCRGEHVAARMRDALV